MLSLNRKPESKGRLSRWSVIRLVGYLFVLVLALGMLIALRGPSGSVSETIGQYLGGLKGVQSLPLRVNALKVVRREQFGYVTAPPGMNFVKVTTKIVSTADEPYFVVPDLFRLVDTAGNSYACLKTSPLFSDRTQGVEEGFYLEPREEVESELVFQIPLGAKERHLHVEPPNVRR